MKEHETEHYEFFDNEIKKRNIKPTKLLHFWDLMWGLHLALEQQ